MAATTKRTKHDNYFPPYIGAVMKIAGVSVSFRRL